MRLVILTKSTPVLRLRARSRIFLPIRSFFSLTSYSWCRNARSPPAFGHSLVTPLSVTQRLESGLEKRGTADTRSDCGSKRELLITGIHPRCPPVYQKTLRVATKYPIILFHLPFDGHNPRVEEELKSERIQRQVEVRGTRYRDGGSGTTPEA